MKDQKLTTIITGGTCPVASVAESVQNWTQQAANDLKGQGARVISLSVSHTQYAPPWSMLEAQFHVLVVLTAEVPDNETSPSDAPVAE